MSSRSTCGSTRRRARSSSASRTTSRRLSGRAASRRGRAGWERGSSRSRLGVPGLVLKFVAGFRVRVWGGGWAVRENEHKKKKERKKDQEGRPETGDGEGAGAAGLPPVSGSPHRRR